MARFILRRLIAAIPVLLVVSLVVFALLRVLPGDPLVLIIGESQADVSDEELEELRRQHGLDRPVYVQYVTWLGDIARGDFGSSIRNRQPVFETLRPRLLPTMQIQLMALAISLMVSLPVAVISATSPNSWRDWLGTIGALFGAAIPYFLVAGALIYFVALRLRWLPASGYVSPFDDPIQSFKLTILPAITLSLGLAAVTTRQARASLVEVLGQTYITAARARGLRERRVILGHAFKNGMLPVVTILGIRLGDLFGGAVITETIFAIPGTGRLLVDAIYSRDYPVVQAIVLFIAVIVVIANLLTDVAYAYLDPRIRY